ncbi:MAG: glucosamine-6-phosphate deaminase, partial [Turicibacter sp.]
QKNGTSYQHVKTVNLDEYYGINPKNSQSYAYFMNENLFHALDINADQINIPSGFNKNPQEECERYDEVLNTNKVDIQVLGIGGNGHIGFNEPGTPFNSTTHVVTLDEQTRADNARFFDSIDEVPQYAITMGIKSIVMANQILLLACGKNKAKAVAHMIQGSVTPDCPASILQMHPNVVVIADEEALSALRVEVKKFNLPFEDVMAKSNIR